MSIRPDDVVLMGRSLGGGVAVALAASNGARALVLENTFSSMTDAAAAHYPWLPVRWTMDNRFDAVSQIRDYRGPLFQSHGTEDEIVPIDQGRRLFDAAPGKLKHWVEIAGLSHNDPWLNSYYDDLATFLDKLGKSRIGGGS
jgi:fermentation-respiration switch protein FrsA (DUF1100 family)